MKLTIAEAKTADVAYLYPDGHLTIIHETRTQKYGKVKWVTIWKSIGASVHIPDDCRLIIKGCVLPFLRECETIQARKADINEGSEKTKSMGLALETILFKGKCDHSWIINNFPGVVSSDIYLNECSPEKIEDFQEGGRWSDLEITKIHKED